jgi:hypothetical protein
MVASKISKSKRFNQKSKKIYSNKSYILKNFFKSSTIHMCDRSNQNKYSPTIHKKEHTLHPQSNLTNITPASKVQHAVKPYPINTSKNNTSHLK